MYTVSKGARGRACFGGLRCGLGADLQRGRIRKKKFERMYMVSKGSRVRACFGGWRSNLGSDFQRSRIRKKLV